MRDQDKDLDLPSFGPAEREPGAVRSSDKQPAVESAAAGGQSGAGARAEVRRAPSSGGGLTFLIVLLLAAAVAGLAYWGYLQHQQLLAQAETQRSLDQKVLELQQLLQVAESSVAQSGETLQETIQQQGSSAAEKFKQLDGEVAKLWVVAHQRNTPKIAELEKQLEQQVAAASKAATAQEARAKSLAAEQDKRLQALTAQLKTLQQSSEKAEAGLAAVKKSADGLATAKKSVASLSAEFQVLNESLELQQAEQKKTLARLVEQVNTLQSVQGGSADLERRIKVNEQAVRAIDGSRILLNKELLQIRQKLNNLQLKIEQL